MREFGELYSTAYTKTLVWGKTSSVNNLKIDFKYIV